jgi:hypothetical protein
MRSIKIVTQTAKRTERFMVDNDHNLAVIIKTRRFEQWLFPSSSEGKKILDQAHMSPMPIMCSRS